MLQFWSMAENDNITFVVSDESINDRGSRILTKGIDTKAFKKNPIMLYNHHRSSDWGDGDSAKLLPIGKWKNVRKDDDGRLIADAVFDETDEFAQSIKSKVEQGILSATSVGLEVLAVSNDEKDLVKGQTRYTITKSRLREISIVDIPANPNALKLSHNNSELVLFSGGQLTSDFEKVIPSIELKSETMPNKKDLFSRITSIFSSAENGNEEEAIQESENLHEELTAVVEERDSLQEQLNTANEQIQNLTAQVQELQGQLNEGTEENNNEESNTEDLQWRITELEAQLQSQINHTNSILEKYNVDPNSVSQDTSSQVEETEEKEEVNMMAMSSEDRALYLRQLAYAEKETVEDFYSAVNPS